MSEEFKNFRDAFKKVKEKTQASREYEKSGDWWTQDSGLLSGDATSVEASYNHRFKDLYPKEFENIKQYLESHLASKKGNLIGIELGGRGSKLFSEFSPGFIERSLGVLLTDHREIQEREEDTAQHHEVLPADLFSSEGKQAIQHWLGGRKADIIFEKMEGGTAKNFPLDTGFMASVFERWYRLLSEKGIMFIESPPLDVHALEEATRWLDTLKNKNLSVEYKLQGTTNGTRLYIVLEKKEGAPENLFAELKTMTGQSDAGTDPK